MAKHCNSYGFLAGVAAVASVTAYVLVNRKECQLADEYGTLQLIHVIMAITGAVTFIVSFFNFAGILHGTKLLFFIACAAIFGVGCAGYYNTYLAFISPCVSLVKGLIPLNRETFTDRPNVVKAEDTEMIAVTALNLLSSLLLTGSSLSFNRRV